MLDDTNGEVRTAAICALEGPLPPTALPKLKKIIEDGDTPQAMVFVFRVIAEYKNREACEILAGYLSAALEDRDKAKNIASGPQRLLNGLRQDVHGCGGTTRGILSHAGQRGRQVVD